MKGKILLTCAICVHLLWGCSETPYQPEKLITYTHPDSLKVDLVTYIGKRPKTVLQENRHQPEHRPYFANLANEFELIYYYPVDTRHYYYLLRPARNHSGNVNRAVGGWYNLNDSNEISHLVEVFNTHIMPVDDLKTIGLTLFEEMIASGAIELSVERKSIIEWPDDRTFYNDSINEWVYKN